MLWRSQDPAQEEHVVGWERACNISEATEDEDHTCRPCPQGSTDEDSGWSATSVLPLGQTYIKISCRES